MHWEQRHFLGTVRKHLPAFFDQVRVLEIGSYDVNGSAREYFSRSDYIGVDLVPGPGVDEVCLGHEYRCASRYDVVLSCECFEHDPHYLRTFLNMVRHTRPGGLVLASCATTGREEHGTALSHPDDSPGTTALGWNHYRNLTEEDFSSIPMARHFVARGFQTQADHADLYFVGITHGSSGEESTRTVQTIVAALGRMGNLARMNAASQLLLAEGDPEAAVAVVKQMVGLEPDDAYLQERLGNLMAATGRRAEAESAYRRALEITPLRHSALRGLSGILGGLGRVQDALAAARDAVAIAPSRGEYHAQLGAMLLRNGQLDEAEQAARTAVSLGSPTARGLRVLSAVLARRGCREEAVDFARSAVEAQPSRVEYRLHLGHLLLSVGEPRQAEEQARIALGLDPTSGRAFGVLGSALARHGELAEAAASLRRAVALNQTQYSEQLERLEHELSDRSENDGA